MDKLSLNILKFFRIVTWATIIGSAAQLFTVVLRFITTILEIESSNKTAFGINFGRLYEYNHWHAYIFSSLLIASLSLYIIFLRKLLRLVNQLISDLLFSVNIQILLVQIAKISLIIGLLSILLKFYAEVIITDKAIFDSTEFYGKAFLYGSGIIYLMSQVFKKGLDLQSENDLTI